MAKISKSPLKKTIIKTNKVAPKIKKASTLLKKSTIIEKKVKASVKIQKHIFQKIQKNICVKNI